ncbi:hypothetical protein C8Q80DRAFT_1350900 [Daedaleopsis nitida]|nr:hypothetical protein C8Q80DRAFT_1350900 [Daedaleopsis nitida]
MIRTADPQQQNRPPPSGLWSPPSPSFSPIHHPALSIDVDPRPSLPIVRFPEHLRVSQVRLHPSHHDPSPPRDPPTVRLTWTTFAHWQDWPAHKRTCIPFALAAPPTPPPSACRSSVPRHVKTMHACAYLFIPSERQSISELALPPSITLADLSLLPPSPSSPSSPSSPAPTAHHTRVSIAYTSAHTAHNATNRPQPDLSAFFPDHASSSSSSSSSPPCGLTEFVLSDALCGASRSASEAGAAGVWYGPVVVLKYAGRRCAGFMDIWTSDLVFLSAFFRGHHG